MWRSGIEILAAQHSPGLDLIDQKTWLDTIVLELHETVHRNQFRPL